MDENISVSDKFFIKRAVQLAESGMNTNKGGPFGCVIVKDGHIIAEGCNTVTSSNDPTAHAEMVAIRKACQFLQSFQLKGCTIYSSCEPCPMCLGAIYWARPEKVFFACNKSDAAKIGFDDEFIYRELVMDVYDRKLKFVNIMRSEALLVFQKWIDKKDKSNY